MAGLEADAGPLVPDASPHACEPVYPAASSKAKRISVGVCLDNALFLTGFTNLCLNVTVASFYLR
jgi:hypothetical protein